MADDGRDDDVTPMTIAMVGTRGVPARYGGFETAVEEVGRRLAAAGHRVVVYCRTAPGGGAAADGDRPAGHLGMELVHLPAARTRSLETLSHSALSVAHLVRHRADVAFVFNAANAPLLPVLRTAGIPVATHVDGLEWQRAKWGGAGRRYYRRAESLAVRWSDALIADAQGIADYYEREFGAPTTLLTYGAPLIAPGHDRLAALGLEPGGYHLVVARFEPENHVDLVVDGYRRSAAGKPLVVVGSAPYSDAYTQRVHELADDRVRFLGGVWDQVQLDQLYAHAYTYLHGHSVGGTNPSLLRAIGAGAAVLAFDVDFNREVVAGAGRYFTDAAQVAALVEAAEADPATVAACGRRARELAGRYDWDDVARGYEALARRLVTGEVPARRPSGRRRPASTGSRVAGAALPVPAVPLDDAVALDDAVPLDDAHVVAPPAVARRGPAAADVPA
jgi:glycosyltransferase involved in cell wall biosynthesis